LHRRTVAIAIFIDVVICCAVTVFVRRVIAVAVAIDVAVAVVVVIVVCPPGVLGFIFYNGQQILWESRDRCTGFYFL
jgi:hypothetical protein